MSYPLIVLGAGASFDFLQRNEYPSHAPDLDQYLPPLTNRLFDGTKFHEIIAKYPEMHKLVDYIRAKLRADNPKTFEQILSDLYFEKVKVDKGLNTSFMSLLFYISDLFGIISQKYYQANNNYGALLKMIGFYGNKAMVVNFNYDLLFERSLGFSDIKSVDELLNGNFPVIKIHGACDWYWSYEVSLWEDEKKKCYEIALNNAEFFLNPGEKIKNWKIVIHNSTDPRRMPARNVNSIQGYSYHPALALPLIGKNNYICPESHIELLKQRIGEIDRILIIGWKIRDPFLKDLIVEELKKRNIPIAFVGGSNTEDIVKELDETIKSNIKLINDKGFSNFLSSDAGEEFLADDTNDSVSGGIGT